MKLVILNEEGEFWGGEDWTDDEADAEVYENRAEAFRDAQDLAEEDLTVTYLIADYGTAGETKLEEFTADPPEA